MSFEIPAVLKGCRFVACALSVAALVWGIAYACGPTGAQSRVFGEHGRRFFADYTETIRPAASGGPHAEGVRSLDICYPALSYVVARAFPATTGGAAVFTGLGMLLFALAVAACGRAAGVSPGLVAGALAVSSPALYAFEWGNPVIHAGACVALWAAWRNAAARWKRVCAAVALACAAVLKIAPGVFALDYLVRRDRDARGFVWFVGAGLALFFAPYLFWGGWDGLAGWFANAAGNAGHYVHKGAWGAVPIGRTVRVLLGMDVSTPWPGIGVERAASVCLGLVCLAGGLRARADYPRILGLTGALLLVPGNMHFYTGVYLAPALVFWIVEPRRSSGSTCLEGICWFFVFSPLQIPFGAGGLNHPLANLAFLALLCGAQFRAVCTCSQAGENDKMTPIFCN